MSPSLRAQVAHDDHEHNSHAHETAVKEDYADHDGHAGHDHGTEAAPIEEKKAPAANAKHDDHTGHDDHAGHDDHEEGVARVSPEVLREFGVKLANAAPGVIHEEIVLPGEIQFNREVMAYVTPRYAGAVTEINARLADQVTKGQVLAYMESSETLRPFTLAAPIGGTIVAYDVSPGLNVAAGAPLFTIADLSTVWADLRIYQRDLGKLRQGQSVTIDGGESLPRVSGKIAYIAPTVDEHTRTGLARVILDNSSGYWRPGQFFKGHVEIFEHPAGVVVPRSAVLMYENSPVVFVQSEEGFDPHPVQLGRGDADSVEIISGLKAGETIAISNVISLKAELNKASFGGHAGHVH